MFLTRLLPLLVGCFVFGVPAYSQNKTKCATSEMEHKLIEENPELGPLILLAEQDLNLQIEEFLKHQKRDDPEYIIPVVFHILFDFGPEKITDEQVRDAIRIVNEDYSASGPDIGDAIVPFNGLVGDAKIEFRLARKDPQGNPTNGIVKILSQETYVGDDGSKLDPWPRAKYLNIWVSREIGSANAAAYAYRPAAVAAQTSEDRDGIICDFTYVGSINSGSGGSSSRTLTHEIGHYLNLSHPWGSTNDPILLENCNDDDGISDTPNTVGNQSCNLGSISCGSLDNVQNFMDYASCEIMFTEGQVNFMHATLNSSVADRDQLWQQSNLEATGVVNVQEADFFMDMPIVCVGQPHQLTDRSFYDQNSWDWNFHGASPGGSSAQHPNVTFYAPGLKRISLEVSDPENNIQSVSRESAVLSVPLIGHHIPHTETFDNIAFPNNDWIGHNLDRDEFGWEHASGLGFAGSDAMKMNNHGNLAKSRDQLYSTSFDLSPLSDVTISFRVAYRQRLVENQDRLFLYLSPDCGATWNPIWSRAGTSLTTGAAQLAAFAPSGNNDWLSFEVNNLPNSLISDHVLLRFEFQNEGGNNLYVDDLSITGTFDDVVVLESPANGADFQDANTLINWKAVEGADSYEYQLDDQSSLFTSGNLISGTTTYLGVDPNDTDTEFQTSGLSNGNTYFWRVRSRITGVDSDWSDVWSFTVATNGVGVNETLEQSIDFKVVPNPIGEVGTLEFKLSYDEDVDLRIYDLFGREVMLLQKGELATGTQQLQLPVAELSSGIYLARLVLGSHDFIEKFVVE